MATRCPDYLPEASTFSGNKVTHSPAHLPALLLAQMQSATLAAEAAIVNLQALITIMRKMWQEDAASWHVAVPMGRLSRYWSTASQHSNGDMYGGNGV